MTSFRIEARYGGDSWVEIGGADRVELAVQGAIAYWESKDNSSVRVLNRAGDWPVFELGI